MASTQQQPEPIAVVGTGCRFPGSASSPSRLWKLLSKPRDVAREIPEERFDLKGYYHPKGSHHGTTNVVRSYMLEEDHRVFDANFFNISPNEADSMDPQQRLLMEVVYEALEAGGHAVEQLRGSNTCVYVGTMSVDYNDIVLRDIESVPTYFATGSSRAILSNRVSYFFDWHGPSMTIDTACSSSMVALHQGVNSLRSGESRVAVIGGTELQLGPEQFVGESKMNLLSPDGRSRMWDADANGYARGDGIAALVLKKLSDAIADGDHIECLIRGTGVNQDGKSTGLTVPSSEAQAALIKDTYGRAGLDITNSLNWPQFFEAHGTGTKAGDPREAAAIYRCFGQKSVIGAPLYVGSVKTVIGHTEGTAGLAGVIKAALAVQHGVVPPNMLLQRLNPEIEQYYANLHVPTSATEWPVLPEGVPRRASINSFGFGGTNGHAIVEQYLPTTKLIESSKEKVSVTPFTFSAATDETLIAMLQDYSAFLKQAENIDLCDLAWTLQSRKSALQSKISFSATTLQGLIAKIDAKLAQKESSGASDVGIRSPPAKPRILGVFTGQGAQWAKMGAALINASAFVRDRLAELDQSLATLPEADRPSWKVADALVTGNLQKAEFSQPLCTAVQVVLVDLLKSAGIEFEAVVGHSSGEIGAAYAADFISAHDAIRIAYYRGVHAKHAKGVKGQKGAMLAVGTSWEDAQELLDLPAFKGRVKIAAQNSAASLTLSGDADAVAHAKMVFDEERKFARLLKVDTAYHSHHMYPCSEPYMASLKACGIKVNYDRSPSCSWYSSVKSGQLMVPSDELRDSYWRDNMVGAVLFADAVKNAGDADKNLAIEVGPHPALKGPAQQTIADIRPPLAYTGVLARGSDDVEALSDALGFIWSQLGAGAVNFESYAELMSPDSSPKLVVGLPSYHWSHKRVHWHVSRVGQKVQARDAAFHELLGVPTANSTDRALGWRNYLKTNEIRWLDGHQLQGQTVFPAAGYVAMALEAGKQLAGERNVAVYEVRDLVIGRAITFDDNANFAAETLVTLTDISPSNEKTKAQTAVFTVVSCPNTGTVDMELVCKGKLNIIYGDPSFSTLSSRPVDDSRMTHVDSDVFYSSLSELGYGYSGPFKTMSYTKRRLGQASAKVDTYNYKDDDETLMVHPSWLDVAFQASFLALSAPGDDQLWSLHVPTSIKCIRVNPELCASLPVSSVALPLSAVLEKSDSLSVRSSIDIFTADAQQTLLQVEGLVVKPFSPATAADDRPLFLSTLYGVEVPDGNMAAGKIRPSTKENEIAEACERSAYFYIRQWRSQATEDQLVQNEPLKSWADQVLSTTDKKHLSSQKQEWADDDADYINSLVSKFPASVDLKLISHIGKTLSSQVHVVDNSLLDEVLAKGLGFAQSSSSLAKMLKQITFRYPKARVLEVGARLGHATRKVFDSVTDAFASYTYTDSSPEMLEAAASSFKTNSNHRKMDFKVFETVKTPGSQDIKEHTYDIVIVSNPLNSDSSLDNTLGNLRRCLKPGGYLLMPGTVMNSPIRVQLMAGTIYGQWSGTDDRRKKNSTKTSVWHSALRKEGFSGVDTITPVQEGSAWPFFVMAAQAVDDRISVLRQPLSSASSVHLNEVVILGNGSLKTSRLAEEISELLNGFCDHITILESLPTDDDEITPMSTFINLADLDDPIFRDITEEKMEGLKCLFELASHILWVTEGARSNEPYHNASLGFGRSITYEASHLSLQFIDLAEVGHSASRLLTEALLRLATLDDWEAKGKLREPMLWSREPELFLENGRVLVPRIINENDQNGRVNSLRRPVTKAVNPLDSTVGVVQAADKSLVLREVLSLPPVEDGKSLINISHSISSALNVAPETFLFLGYGTKEANGKVGVALSESLATKTITSKCVPVKVTAEKIPMLLAGIANELFAGSIISKLPNNSHILIHEADQHDLLPSILTRQAADRNIHVTFSTSKSDQKDSSWIQLDPWTSEHVVREWIPAGVTHFLDLAADYDAEKAGFAIRECLPSGCRKIKISELMRFQSRLSVDDDSAIVRSLKEAVNQAKKSLDMESVDVTVSANDIKNVPLSEYPTKVIDWTLDSSLAVQVQPIDASHLFSSDKTYLMAGLAGQLGQSICEWMSRNGAGHICVTSRKPNPDQSWVASMKKRGTVVEFFAMDITSRQDVEKTVAEIRSRCPPIAGVANGAAIFNDGPFSEMPLETFEKVLKPKIDGTKYLDDIFNDRSLDFFIVFSSVASIVGNSGQTHYSAANAYMTAVMSRRRQRGQAGTSLDIGRVAGLGYVERAGPKAREQLIRMGCMAVSETDIHQLLAEAIVAGAPDSGRPPIVTTGVRTVTDTEEPRVSWFDNPKFSHKVILGSGDGASQDGGKKSAPVRDQLVSATTMEAALEIIKDCFAAKLAAISQLPESEVGHNVPLVELGIDSLVAVEVRSWFLKELKTDMPVLKVLGGGSVADLCGQALEKLPADFLPSVASTSPKPAETKAPATENTPKEAVPKRVTTFETATNTSTEPSDGSSGSRTPPDTPATQLSPSPSMVDLSTQASKKVVMHGASSDPKPAHVKTELMSFAQSRFWFLRLLVEDHTTFNIAIRTHITGNLRIGDLERAVRLVGNRHESLRTRFIGDEEEADKAHQRVLPSSPIRLERKDISSADEIQAEYAAVQKTPYDIESGNLMRLVLLSRSPTEHELIIGYHHILLDGVGFQVFLSDLEKAYKRQSLNAPPRQLPEFSRTQRESFENGEWDEQISYWRNEFPDGHPVLPLLPMAKVSSRVPMKSFNVHQVETRLKPELVTRIKDMSKSLRSTTFHFYLAVYKAMLFRFTGAEDLTIGIADANRNEPGTMGMVGLLLNLLTLRFKASPDQKFGECVAEARTKTYDALNHSKVAFDVLLKELNVPRSSSYSPFFQAFLDYRQGQQEKRTFGNTDLQFLELHAGRTAYDMTVDITEGADSSAILFRVQSGLYDETAAQLLLDTYVHFLDVFSSNTSMPLEKASLFSEEACTKAVDVGRGPSLKSSWPATLPRRIDQVAKENGEKVALQDGHDTTLTYNEMVQRVEAIAETLQKNGVEKGSRVLVFEDATTDWPCSMLAIMRLGAVYVPLDLRNPLPRLAEVAESCQPTAILVDATTLKDTPQVNVTQAKLVNVSEIASKSSASVANISEADDVAAILYTSGSTGKPKGIVVKHSGLRNEIEGYTTQWGLKAERVLQQSAFTFNHSSDQMYTGLVNGGSVYIVPWSKRGDPIEVSNLIQEQDITYTKATPAEYSLWLDYGNHNLQKASKWRFAFGGGEELTSPLLKKLAGLNLAQLRFFNSYGPTEISISSTKMEIAYREQQPEGRIPCGFSLPNYVAYILDENLEPVPVGMPGELWIGGAGVSLGYLNNKELTEHHFVTDPYASEEYTAQGWNTMYRTGDIAHLQPNGAMVFHSRVAGDTQIKIRGLRIELGDIERNIVKAADGALNEAIVTLREGEPPFLVAHVVFAPKHKVTDTEKFLDQLLTRLEVPQYMVPVMAIPLDRMPLNNHSKVDRAALKVMDLPQRREAQSNDEEGDMPETMIQLKRVWEEVLNTKSSGLSITPSTSFFTIGGNSLLIVRLQSRIRSVFNVTIRLIDLLNAKTLKDMVSLIQESTSVDVIDWEKEVALPAKSTSLSGVKCTPLKTNEKEVLVTGAGGFLGKHILAELVANPEISKIHCIGLREKPAGTPRKLDIESPKIITYTGDLSSPRLGLSETDFEMLAGTVDSVLHMGAVRSFWDNYYTLRPSNVSPTKQLVTLAAARHVPIHYVSTAGVMPEDQSHQHASSMSAHKPPTDGSQGYAASRWASEQILTLASSTMGIPSTVHRFVSAKQSSSSAGEAAMETFLNYVDTMSLMPDLSGTTGYFEMTAVDKAAGALASAVVGQSSATEPSFVHHECEVRIDVPTIDEYLQARRGEKGLNTIPGLRFVGRTKALGLQYFVTTQNLVMEGGEGTLRSRR